jgi:hypothetical protein
MSTFKGRMAVLSLWFLPDWFVRWLPPAYRETIEREVYDGLTRHEWFTEQVRACHVMNAKQAALSVSEEEECSCYSVSGDNPYCKAHPCDEAKKSPKCTCENPVILDGDSGPVTMHLEGCPKVT